MDIRPYLEADEHAVAALWREVFPDAPPRNEPVANIRRKLGVQRELFFVAVVDGSLAGTAMAGTTGIVVGLVRRRCRSPVQASGRRHGTHVSCGEGVGRLGCPKLNLQVLPGNRDAVEFYRKLGYRVEERISMGKVLIDEA